MQFNLNLDDKTKFTPKAKLFYRGLNVVEIELNTLPTFQSKKILQGINLLSVVEIAS